MSDKRFASDFPKFGEVERCPKCESPRKYIDGTLLFSLSYCNSRYAYQRNISGDFMEIGCNVCGHKFKEQCADKS